MKLVGYGRPPLLVPSAMHMPKHVLGQDLGRSLLQRAVWDPVPRRYECLLGGYVIIYILEYNSTNRNMLFHISHHHSVPDYQQNRFCQYMHTFPLLLNVCIRKHFRNLRTCSIHVELGTDSKDVPNFPVIIPNISKFDSFPKPCRQNARPPSFRFQIDSRMLWHVYMVAVFTFLYMDDMRVRRVCMLSLHINIIQCWTR